MSYLSGFMMGAAIGKGIRQCFSAPVSRRAGIVHAATPAKCHAPESPLALVSATPGRRRYRMQPMQKELASFIEEKLGQLSFIKSVTVNPQTGSIVLLYLPKADAKVAAFMREMKRRLFSEKRVDVPDESHAGAMTRSIRGTGRAFSGWIKKNSGGVFDFNMLVAIVFAVRGFQKFMTTPGGPTGAQLLWWALSLMRGWRTV